MKYLSLCTAVVGLFAIANSTWAQQAPVPVQSHSDNTPAGHPGASTGTTYKVSPGSQRCVFTFSQPIATGDTVVGYIHSANDADNFYMVPQSVSDNAGNSYVLSAPVDWLPWKEGLNIFYLMNIQGNPTSFTFDYSQYPASGQTVLADGCNVGFTEYSGVSGVSVVGPMQISGRTPSLSIAPTAPAVIWVFTADWYADNTLIGDPNSPQGAGSTIDQNTALLQDPGFPYSTVIDNWGEDNIMVWASDGPVETTPLTLTLNAPGADTCAWGSCPTVIAAAALQPNVTDPPPPPVVHKPHKLGAAVMKFCQSLGFVKP